MLGYLAAVGAGVGIGYSITQSERTVLDNGVIRTQYIHNKAGYNMGWRFDRHRERHEYDLSLKFYPDPPNNNRQVRRGFWPLW
jgi:hypothetical protein